MKIFHCICYPFIRVSII